MTIKKEQHSVALEQWRSSSTFLKSITMMIISCYLFVFYSPSVQAIIHTEAPNRVVFSANEQLMLKVKQLLTDTQKYLSYRFDVKQRQHATTIYQKKLTSLMNQLAEKRIASEKQIKSDLSAAQASENQQAIQLYKQQLAALYKEYHFIENELVSITQANARDVKTILIAATKLDKHLSKLKFGKSHHEYDSETMPFGPLSSVVHKPAQTSDQLLQRLQSQQSDSVLKQYSSIKRAKATGSYRTAMSTDAAAGDMSEYLSFNVDNAVTDKLTSLALSLSHDPVQIYQYVYNNIEYVPAHGSIQGADYTAQSLKGGAIDQASLLIALLRISNVPARYVYGSIDVDIEQAMNWVGGVQEPIAAQNILSQGGVPNTLLLAAPDDIIGLNIEHVWVEAYIDDTWQAIDPSFKQYDYQEGINLEEAIDIDEATLVANITSGATIDEHEGWVQNVNQEAIETELTSIQSQIESYINAQYPDATVEEILGSKTIIPNQQSQLSPDLPYKDVRTSEFITEIPNNLRHKFGFDLKDEYNTTKLSFEKSLPELAGKRLALSFTPATEEDEQKLLNALPENVETEADLPSQLAYGLFNVEAKLSLDETTVATSTSSFAFGQELNADKGFWEPRFNWQKKNSVVIAGEYQAIGIDYHGVSSDALTAIKTLLDASKTAIETETLGSLTSHNTTGAIMQAGIHTYFAATNAQNQLTAIASNVINYRQPSYGTFGTSLTVNYFFGLPQNVGFSGVVMDVDRLINNSESITNCWNTWSDYNRQSGATLSYYENLVPEQMFSTEEEQLDGISAVKALAIASSQGQKIYTLTSNNAHLINDITMEAAIKQEVQLALNNGKEITIHEQPINEFGWTGTGYVIVDPETGAGAYKIGGGENGGALSSLGVGFSLEGIFISSAHAGSAESLSRVSLANDVLGIIIACVEKANVTQIIASVIILTVIALVISYLSVVFGTLVAKGISLLTQTALSKTIRAYVSLVVGSIFGGGLLNGSKSAICN